MTKNYFYLSAGILFILLAVTHTLFGLGTALPILHDSSIDSSITTIFTFQLHMIGVQDLIYGIAAVIMSFQRDMTRVRFAARMIVAILFARWVIMALITAIYDIGNIMDLLTSSIAFSILIVLLLLGTKVQSRQLEGSERDSGR